MNESEWLASDDPLAMLEALPTILRCDNEQTPDKPDVSDRKLRLFACACTNHVRHLWTDKRYDRAVEVAELFADGLATPKELAAASAAASAASAAASAARYAARGNAWTAASDAASAASDAASAAAVKIQAGLLREIVGNPWRQDHVHVPYHKRADWFTPTVVAIAQTAYDDRDFDALPILADALEDAGVEGMRCGTCKGRGQVYVGGGGDPEDDSKCWDCGGTGHLPHPLLDHLRGKELCPACGGSKWHPGRGDYAVGCVACRSTGWIDLRGPHVRGCWALDLILGKS